MQLTSVRVAITTVPSEATDMSVGSSPGRFRHPSLQKKQTFGSGEGGREREGERGREREGEREGDRNRKTHGDEEEEKEGLTQAHWWPEKWT